MASDKTVLYLGPRRTPPSAMVARFAREHGLALVTVEEADEIEALLNRAYPGCVMFQVSGDVSRIAGLARGLKQDPFTAIVPLIAMLPKEAAGLAADLLAAGIDEVVSDILPEREYLLRLDQVVRRADRDVSVHPTTRLPGTHHIARDMQARLSAGELFAVCYVDLDHFKEFNDRSRRPRSVRGEAHRPRPRRRPSGGRGRVPLGLVTLLDFLFEGDVLVPRLGGG